MLNIICASFGGAHRTNLLCSCCEWPVHLNSLIKCCLSYGFWCGDLKKKTHHKQKQRGEEGCFPACCSYIPYPAFLYSQTTCPGGALSTLVRTFHFSHQLRKCTIDLPTCKHYRDIFPSSQMCQVNIKLAAKVFLHWFIYSHSHLFIHRNRENTLQVYFPRKLICYHEKKL